MSISPYSAPIEFEFYNEDQKPNLLLTHESSGRSMTLELQNASQEQIAYDETDSHHFELIFRPGTLMNPEQIAVESVGYTLINTPVVNDDGTLSVLIKANEERLWSVREHIQLSGFKVEAGIGTRSTRMMLRYQHLKHGAGDFSGHLETQLHIENSIGRINIPMQVGFLGDNHVLNNGHEENVLIIRVTNPLRFQQIIPGNENSKLVLETQSGDLSEEWALGTTSQLSNLNVTSSQAGVDVTRVETSYFIEFKSIDSGAYFDLVISNIITGHPTGHTNLTLHYENIPGYSNGQFVLVVEKSHLVFRGEKVGVGTASPDSFLQVIRQQGTKGISITNSDQPTKTRLPDDDNWNYLAGKGLIIRDDNNVEKNRFDASSGKVGMGTSSPSAKLHIVDEPGDPNAGTLILGPVGSHSNLRMGYHSQYSWIQSRGSKPLSINSEGNNVGVGTTSPSEKLDIAGNVRVSGSIRAEGGVITDSIKALGERNWEIRSSGENLEIGEPEDSANPVSARFWDNRGLHLIGTPNLYADGKIGIGTTSPEKLLHIANRGGESHPGIRIEGGVGPVPLGDTGRTTKGIISWDIVVDANDSDDQDLLFRLNSKTKFIMEPGGDRVRVSSDERLKKDIEPLESVLEKVCALIPSRYRWKEDAPEKEKDMGFIAQEVEQLFPHLVKEKEGFKNISYTDFGVLAIAAIKEQQVEIDNLKKEVTEIGILKRELAEQRKMIEQLIKSQTNN